MPHLAGESEIYLARQLEASRAGARREPQMSLMAAPPSDEDVANVAAWYSSIEISAKMPE
jgi:cytochrome c553